LLETAIGGRLGQFLARTTGLDYPIASVIFGGVSMRRLALLSSLAVLVFLAAAVAAPAQVGPVRIAPVQPEGMPPNVPVLNPDPNFPLRVHLLTARFGGIGGRYHGYGSGNLLNASGAAGFDFGFECDVPFVPNQSPNETYQARWARSQYKLEILTTETGVGTPREHACELRLAFADQPFQPANTAALTHGVSSSIRRHWQDPDFAFEDPQRDYPLQFHVVDGQRTEDPYQDHGWGTANLAEPGAQNVQGAEFKYDCSYGFLTNTQLSGFYQGRWIKPGSELEVLLRRPGSEKVDRCTVEVNLRPQPYPESRHIRVETQAASSAGMGGQAPGTP
jgi:hypothetical protein